MHLMKISVCSSHSKWSFKYAKPLEGFSIPAPKPAFGVVKTFPIHLPEEKMREEAARTRSERPHREWPVTHTSTISLQPKFSLCPASRCVTAPVLPLPMSVLKLWTACASFSSPSAAKTCGDNASCPALLHRHRPGTLSGCGSTRDLTPTAAFPVEAKGAEPTQGAQPERCQLHRPDHERCGFGRFKIHFGLRSQNRLS